MTFSIGVTLAAWLVTNKQRKRLKQVLATTPKQMLDSAGNLVYVKEADLLEIRNELLTCYMVGGSAASLHSRAPAEPRQLL